MSRSEQLRAEAHQIAGEFLLPAGWDEAVWSYGGAIEQLGQFSALSATRDELAAQLVDRGWGVVPLRPLNCEPGSIACPALTLLCSAIARPLSVFSGRPLWRLLGVDPRRPVDRSGGVGDQPLHLDFVNAAYPPDFVFLFCVRSDPLGGGTSLVASTSVAGSLDDDARALLARPVFRDGKVSDLSGVGEDINPFSVLNSHGRIPLRFTGKLLAGQYDPDVSDALRRLAAILDEHTERVPLAAGELLVIDQRRALHGREALGSGQSELPTERTRLLMHGFGRAD